MKNRMQKKFVAMGIFVLLATIVTGCTETKLSTAKQYKHKMGHGRHRLQGVVSLDIFQDQDGTHVLVGKQTHHKKTLWYQFSEDGGKIWSVPVEILGKDNLAVNMGRGRDAQIAAKDDDIYVTWTQYTDQNHFHSGPMRAARSVDHGKTWEKASAPPDWAQGSHGFIDLGVDSYGIRAVWLDSRDGQQGLRYSRSNDGGISWAVNRTLDKKSCSCCWNTMKTDSENNSYIIYRDKNPSDMSMGVIDAHENWRYLGHVGKFDWQFEGCPHIGAGLDFEDRQGKLRMHAIVGTGKQDVAGLYYWYSDNRSENGSSVKRLGDDSAMHGDIASNDGGQVVAVWDMRAENGLAIFMAQSADSGQTWSAAQQISTQGNRASHPRIVYTPFGFLVLWSEHQNHRSMLMMRRLK